MLAPPNPLRGVGFDASVVSDVAGAIDGPVVLVGHSYGGAVIGQASAGGFPRADALVLGGRNAAGSGVVGVCTGITPGGLVPWRVRASTRGVAGEV